MRGFAKPGSKGLSVTRAGYGAAERGKAVESRRGEVKVKVRCGFPPGSCEGPAITGKVMAVEDLDDKGGFEGTQGKFLFLSQTLLYSYRYYEDYEGRLPAFKKSVNHYPHGYNTSQTMLVAKQDRTW